MKSKCLSERLKRLLKRWFLRKSNLVAIKHLCSNVRPQWEANVWSAQAHLPAGDKGPGPALCREPVMGGVTRSPLVKDGALPEEIGGKVLGRGEEGVSSASLPAGLSPA